MLVLSRLVGERVILNPAGERVTLDGPISVELIYVGRNHARLGVTAPPAVNILREELFSRDAERGVPAVEPPAVGPLKGSVA